jgi:hypothetical protein
MDTEGGSNIASISLTDFIRQSFGQDFIDTLKEYDLTTRDLFELSTPTTQCTNIIGDCIDPSKCMCWLCGLPVYMNEAGTRVTKKEDIADKFYPECEHVLPIIQAVLILGGLYSESRKQVPDETWNHMIEKTLPLEYKWSHHLCNHTKSDLVFIDNKGNILHSVLDDYLRKIYSGLKDYIPTKPSFAAFKTNRMEAIDAVLTPIRTYIQTYQTVDNLFLLSAVSNAKSHIENIRDILSTKSKVYAFFQVWKPEIIEEYRRPFLTTVPLTTIISLQVRTLLDRLPIHYIQTYIRDTLLLSHNPRQFVEFYNVLLGTAYTRILQIKDIDIRNAIFVQYFLRPEDIELSIYLLEQTVRNAGKAEIYLIDLCFLIIHYRILLACASMEGVVQDQTFLTLIRDKLATQMELPIYKLDCTTYLFQTFLGSVRQDILPGLPILSDTSKDTYDRLKEQHVSVWSRNVSEASTLLMRLRNTPRSKSTGTWNRRTRTNRHSNRSRSRTRKPRTRSKNRHTHTRKQNTYIR